MAIEQNSREAFLRAFDFRNLFVEELGWDRPASRLDEVIEIDGARFALSPVADKRGVRIFHCAAIPENRVRKRIERELTKSIYEHLIIFTDEARTQQIWQWVEREKGKPAAVRDHIWQTSQSPELMLQKLEHIVFPLESEEALTLAGTIRSLKDAFTREQITRRFFGEFQTQHAAFLGFIRGLEAATDRQWYASLMLNRLMFVYFIQRKGFLDSNPNYLRDRLARVRAERGEGQFHSFYRVFLLTLFHGGLAKPADERDAATNELLGTIPYLNGGLFEPHVLEAEGNSIEIADEAFQAVFDFFDRYDWTLDTRPITRNDGREINPDVLGHIFEKYINQKQMGAYYTKEDITDYITKNTVIPWLFQNAIVHDKLAFEPGSAVWRMLSENPDAYIYPAVKHGADQPLPDHIAAGITDVAQRGDWNKTAPSSHGLPTETWRELVARRERYANLKAKATGGEISSIEDFITLNLDIRQFARDAIQYAESSDLVDAFWKGIRSIKVLDPACGSGAFLFAALNILYDLYDACLERMEQFVESSPPTKGGYPPYKKFREELEAVARHPNRSYFIYKSIILDNLYGVDIMDEAVEICKLRLFLKLASQLESADQIEPLPDIDFNIRAGNTLIGYTSMADVRKATEAKGFDFDDRAGQIEAAAQDLDAAFRLFREQQTALHGAIGIDHKAQLRERLAALEAQLDRFLANDYGVVPSDGPAADGKVAVWKASHKPFHWLIEFYGIITAGGFDVIVGNPPYLVYPNKDVPYHLPSHAFSTLSTKNLYSFIIERSISLAAKNSPVGKIVPLTSTSSERMEPLQEILRRRGLFAAISFPRRPQSIFSGVEMPVSILLSLPDAESRLLTTSVVRFSAEQRPTVTEKLGLIEHNFIADGYRIGKIGNKTDLDLLAKFQKFRLTLHDLTSKSGKNRVYYQEACRYWLKASNVAPRFLKNGVAVDQPHGRIITFDTPNASAFASLILNSSTFYWFYSTFSDCEHVNDALVRKFKLPSRWDLIDWLPKASALNKAMAASATAKTITTKLGDKIEYDEISASKAKKMIDGIEREIANLYGFSDTEADYLINYDIKYRMGADEGNAT
jgi:hypothetical protein